jgi:hypothetical protein
MIKIKLKPNQFLNKNVWKSFKSENFTRNSDTAISKSNGKIVRKTLNKEQAVEYELIKTLSVKLIIDNYGRNPTFQNMKKTKIGYTITRFCKPKQKVDCRWNIYIKIDTNEAILTCNKECQNKNPIKRLGLILIL